MSANQNAQKNQNQSNTFDSNAKSALYGNSLYTEWKQAKHKRNHKSSYMKTGVNARANHKKFLYENSAKRKAKPQAISYIRTSCGCACV